MVLNFAFKKHGCLFEEVWGILVPVGFAIFVRLIFKIRCSNVQLLFSSYTEATYVWSN